MSKRLHKCVFIISETSKKKSKGNTVTCRFETTQKTITLRQKQKIEGEDKGRTKSDG